MKFFRSLSTVAAAASIAALTIAAPANAKNFKIAVGDSGGSSQEATGIGFVKALEELSGGKHTATLFLNGQLGSEQDTVNDAANRYAGYVDLGDQQRDAVFAHRWCVHTALCDPELGRCGNADPRPDW